MPRRFRPLILALSVAWGACSSGADDAPATRVEDLAIQLMLPEALVPGSTLVVEGTFADLDPAFVELDGNFDGAPVNLLLPATLKGLGRLEVKWNGGIAMGLPADDGNFAGTVRVTASVPADPREHLSPKAPASLRIASKLQPQLFGVQEGVFQVNDAIQVEGNDFLLGGGEGKTMAILEGCFQKQGESYCAPIQSAKVPVSPNELSNDPTTQRRTGTFPFAPKIAGIEAGYFIGTIRLNNEHASGATASETAQLPIQVQLMPSTLTAFSPPEASLGQYVEISGGGFVGTDKNVDDPTPAATRIQLAGEFVPTGAQTGNPVNLELVTEYVSGKLVRYVLAEEDALGKIADLRTVTGQFKGTATPIVTYGSTSLSGGAIQVALNIAPIKQVVWLNWLPTYRRSLENLGLRAADQKIRLRILESMREAYQGVNIDFRLEPPLDFKLYATVDFEGPDPNGLGLLGYDNTAGKDKGNDRLGDKIGGVNAQTQEGGYPGYGGVFLDSLFGFSEHPGKFAQKLDVSDPLFDKTFDPFRPDRGGKPVLAHELGSDLPVLTDGAACPATDRKLRIACAIWVLGSMIGTTAAHEVGHSLGLADPEGEDFHNPGDEPDRLMDSGGARTFKERAQLGEGPGIFCDGEMEYLRKILPSLEADPHPVRPTCF